jgi:hypothetical protein
MTLILGGDRPVPPANRKVKTGSPAQAAAFLFAVLALAVCGGELLGWILDRVALFSWAASQGWRP